MRRYADPVEVRRGPIDQGAGEGPQQFLWRGRLWKVRAVVAHWVETAPWWQSIGARAAIGVEEGAEAGVDGALAQAQRTTLGDLVSERELWRVEAGRGRPRPVADPGAGAGNAAREPETLTGVFDLSFDWAEGRWTLVGCAD